MKALRLLICFIVALPVSWFAAMQAIVIASRVAHYDDSWMGPVMVTLAGVLLLLIFHGLNKLLLKFERT